MRSKLPGQDAQKKGKEVNLPKRSLHSKVTEFNVQQPFWIHQRCSHCLPWVPGLWGQYGIMHPCLCWQYVGPCMVDMPIQSIQAGFHELWGIQKQRVAGHLATLFLNSTHCLASQHLKGNHNVVADLFSPLLAEIKTKLTHWLPTTTCLTLSLPGDSTNSCYCQYRQTLGRLWYL